jgi:hypothetical protein
MMNRPMKQGYDVGTLQIDKQLADEAEFHDLLEREECRREWFSETEAQAFADHGFRPNATQCIGFKIPVIFSESKDVPDNAYVADLYEQVSFLGDLHRQVANSPDGSLVRLRPIE